MKQLSEFKTRSESERLLLLKCRDAVKKIEPSAEIILYGSRARGNAEPESDYDFLILTDG